MLKFIYEPDELPQWAAYKHTVERIEMEVNSEVGLEEILEAFASFIKSTGYNFNGMLVTLDPDKEYIEDITLEYLEEVEV